MAEPPDFDIETVDDTVLALLCLTMFVERGMARAWKSHDWDAMNRLHEKGYIHDPRTKAKSVVLTDEGKKRAAELFDKLFRQGHRATARKIADIEKRALKKLGREEKP